MSPMLDDEDRSARGFRSPLGERLSALPEFEPPAGGWERLEQRRRRPQRRLRHLAGGGLALAASVLLAVTLMVEGPSQPDATPGLVASAAPTPQQSQMPQLIKVSQQLEQRLGQLRPRVALWNSQRAQQARELQQALELIDLQLNYADRATAEQLWRERIALMTALVELHQQPSTRFHHASYQY